MGLLEDRRAQHKAREQNRNWGLALSGRSPIVAPMYGDRQAGREQPAITVEPPDGRHLVVEVASQSWDGRLDLGGTVVRDEGWSSQSPVTGASDEAVAPTTSTYDLHVDLDTDEVDDVTVSVEVDGTEVGSTTLDLHGRLMWVLPVGTVERGQALTILTDKAVAVTGGLVGVQTIEPSVGRVLDEPRPAPDETAPTVSGSDQETADTSEIFAAPSGTEEGDIIVAAIVQRPGVGGTYGAHTPASEFTLVHAMNIASPKRRFEVYYKVADATDATSGRDYTWQFTGDSYTWHVAKWSLPGTSFPDADLFGTAVTDEHSSSDPLSLSTSDGDWVLAVAVSTGSATGGTGDDPQFASPTETLGSGETTGNRVKGGLRVGSAQEGATVEASFDSGATWAALMLLPVAP